MLCCYLHNVLFWNGLHYFCTDLQPQASRKKRAAAGPKQSTEQQLSSFLFATKDTNVPVQVQIRPVIAGVPDISVLPGASKFVGPSSVNVTAEGNSLTAVQGNPTDFTFEEPIYLKPFTEYAIVVLAQSDQYTCYTAKSGDFLVNSIQSFGIDLSLTHKIPPL